MKNFFKKPLFVGIFIFTIPFQGCNSKHDQNEFTELKINMKLQKLSEEETLKITKYRNSICRIAEFYSHSLKSGNFEESSTSYTYNESDNFKDADIKTFKSNTQLHYEISTLKTILKLSKGSITIQDINSILEFSSFLEKIDKDWNTADIYSYYNHEGIFSSTLRFSKKEIECVSEFQERKAESKLQQ